MSADAPSAGPQIETGLFDRPLTVSDAIAPPPGCGGDCLFLGRTRPEVHPAHGELRDLDYECHRPLAEAALDELARAIASEFGCGLVRLLHATGPVPIGAASVLIQTATPHRAAAFAATRAGIDRLKQSIPIWKRERWTTDVSTWAHGTPVTPGGSTAEASS